MCLLNHNDSFAAAKDECLGYNSGRSSERFLLAPKEMVLWPQVICHHQIHRILLSALFLYEIDVRLGACLTMVFKRSHPSHLASLNHPFAGPSVVRSRCYVRSGVVVGTVQF